MWLHTDHSKEQLEIQDPVHLMPDPGPVSWKRGRVWILGKQRGFLPSTFHKLDYFQKHAEIHSLRACWLHHRSLQSLERIISHVGSEDDTRDHLPRSSSGPHCGTAAAQHHFSSAELPSTPKAGQSRWSKDNFPFLKLNLVS